MKKTVGVVMGMLVCMSLMGCSGIEEQPVKKQVDRAMTQSEPVQKMPEEISLDVKWIDQTKAYPTGCEAVSAVATLQYLGYQVTPEEMIDLYLEQGDLPYEKDGIWYGEDPNQVFIGDPKSQNGYGCYAPVICNAVNHYFQEIGEENKKAKVIQGKTLSELCETYLAKGIPVIIWATIDMQPVEYRRSWILSDGSSFMWTSHEHCLVLSGYHRGTYQVCDPRQGMVEYEQSLLASRYEEMNLQAVVIE